jgi:cell division protein FtsB
MIWRRRNGGDGQRTGRGKGQGHDHQPGAAPRVRGAWTTPAVVVRAPDGSVVEPRTRPRAGRTRIPPPGVPGGVLASPTRAAAAKPLSSRAAPAGGKRPSSGARAKRAASRPRGNGTGPRGGAVGARPRRREVAATGANRLVSLLRLDRLTPVDEEARERRNARLRWLGTRVGSVAVSLLLVYAVFPVRTYLSQRSDTNRAREQLEVLSNENDRLERRADELRDPETIEEIARRDHNLVMPGEESYAILPPPQQAPADDTEPTPGG